MSEGIEISIGGGFLSLLSLVFVVAKIWGYIDWSWWLVFLPVLIPLALVIIVGIVLLIMLFFYWLVEAILG